MWGGVDPEGGEDALSKRIGIRVADKSEDKQRNGDTERPDAQQAISIAVLTQEFRSFVAEYKAAHDENRDHNESVHTWTRRAAFGVFIYTALTLGIVVIALCQLQTSRDAEQRQLRAYIGAFPEEIIQPTVDAWALQIIAHNYGQTPARFIQINGGWELLAFPEGEEQMSPRHFAYLREDNSGLDIYPAKDGVIALPPFSAEMIAQMRGYSGPLRIYAAGIVTYKDVFGHLQHTDYCSVITPYNFVAAIDKPGVRVTFDWCVGHNHGS
jgi:hypothetical protein